MTRKNEEDICYKKKFVKNQFPDYTKKKYIFHIIELELDCIDLTS